VKCRCRLASVPCFGSNLSNYEELMATWMALSKLFNGWTLTEIRELSYRERLNWLEMARVSGKVVKDNG
jgi:FtsZ-interacting cell division protein ZipA